MLIAAKRYCDGEDTKYLMWWLKNATKQKNPKSKKIKEIFGIFQTQKKLSNLLYFYWHKKAKLSKNSQFVLAVFLLK
jgi:hypothetical protein